MPDFQSLFVSLDSDVIFRVFLSLVLGFIMMLFPQSISDVLCYTLGIVLTVYGLFNIISFFINIYRHFINKYSPEGQAIKYSNFKQKLLSGMGFQQDKEK